MRSHHSIGGVLALVTAAAVLTGCGAGPERKAAPADPYPSPVSPTPTSPVAPRDSAAPASPVAPRDSVAPTGPAVPPPADLPTWSRATAPPDNPTDAIKKSDIVVGTVTRGGSGPCYGVQTDDGTQYALYSSRGEALVRGTRVKARTKVSRLRIDCGAGRFLEMTTVELMR